jgi:hypothetical protein
MFADEPPTDSVREPTEEELAEARAWRHANFPGIRDEPPTDSLVERLRFFARRDEEEFGPNALSRTIREAAARIEELERG